MKIEHNLEDIIQRQKMKTEKSMSKMKKIKNMLMIRKIASILLQLLL
jgi:hypothetical protein